MCKKRARAAAMCPLSPFFFHYITIAFPEETGRKRVTIVYLEVARYLISHWAEALGRSPGWVINGCRVCGECLFINQCDLPLVFDLFNGTFKKIVWVEGILNILFGIFN